jgi:hypothetical protein
MNGEMALKLLKVELGDERPFLLRGKYAKTTCFCEYNIENIEVYI